MTESKQILSGSHNNFLRIELDMIQSISYYTTKYMNKVGLILVGLQQHTLTAPPLHSRARRPLRANGGTLADAMLLRSGRRVATEKEEGRATAPRKRRGAVPDRFSAFPGEILREVLVRLPARSVLRCRAVCRSRRRLASGPAFLLDHHRRQPDLPLVSSSRIVDGADVPTTRLEAVQLRGAAEFRPVYLFPELFWCGFDPIVDTSCDGMVIICRKICNPATRQSRSFSRNPTFRYTRIIGLFHHQPSGEYRVLFWRHPSLPYDVQPPMEYCVLTVGSYAARQIKYSLTPVDGVDHVSSEMGPWIFDSPVRLRGSLHMHWKANSADCYRWIMVFDRVAESFRHMRPPAAVNPGRGAHLFDMGGTLAVCTGNDGMSEMSIFTLQDHQHDVWAFHYQINLPVMDIRRFQEQGDWCAKVVSEKGDVLVSCRGQLLHCDRKGNLVASYPYDAHLPVVIPHRFKESLVQPTFFQKENDWF